MASIVLSFVGNQDPFANTDTEGSIVSLVRHLLAQNRSIQRVVLLYTLDTRQNAIDTHDHLTSAPFHLNAEVITLLPVDDTLSHDPVSQFLAAQAARYAIDQIKPDLAPEDTLECNASSGTPALKSAWGILQAAGYASAMRVWQVRNPQKMRPGQLQVFQDDVNALKNEFDLKVIKQQIADYNYSGALANLEATNLSTKSIVALLHYGFYRLSLDFDRAFSCLNSLSTEVDPQWLQEVAPLRQKDRQALLKEAYFNARIKLKNRKYAEFLVMLSGLQENVLRFLVNERVGLRISSKYSDVETSWQQIRQAEQGKLYQHLQHYTLPKGGMLRLDGSIGRYVYIAILDYYRQFADIMEPIKELNAYCDQRNASVHEFVGISEIEDEAKVLANLRKVIKRVAGTPEENPFDRLNQQINSLLALPLSSGGTSLL
ncbi:hypothetical protein C7B61_01225 [filamentous cyanobacterium CCP1]|nr:hypothetical protein C7B76_01990 [filamentous cyanobacterium CCP2]PSB68371.1 hypothetical protein C7B61_01225 [filamentous cyanobacterium CCP1]